MPSTRSRASYNPLSSSPKGYRHDYGGSQSVSEGQGSVNESQTDKLCHYEAYTTTGSLSGHIKIQPEGIQQCTSAQRLSNPRRPVAKLHELLPDCEKVSGPSQDLQGTEWMASIDGKEENYAYSRRMEEEQPSTAQTGDKASPGGQEKKLQCVKAATSSEQGQGQRTSHKTIQPRLQNPKYSTLCHVKYFPDGQSHDGNAQKGGSQIKI
ncbi:hypothetical protein O181_013745 [Austropuccinia psidii MF-1]|uniref:Uncharacterized protein n=1 Tax=Austropuccinia psidii MF-1 TaxID=1389203 RepID=A0A9Q3C0I2_9BASI|nr:hypothetical protein [Austropuccinia psidii MF-1]